MHARALPSVPRHVPIWANFVVYGPILKISNAMCISNGNLEFSPQMTHYVLALSTPPRITIGFPMQNAEGPNSAKLSKNREFFENQ